jgi:hypothetical protein
LIIFREIAPNTIALPNSSTNIMLLQAVLIRRPDS